MADFKVAVKATKAFAVAGKDADGNPVAVDAAAIVWAVDSAIGSIDGNGLFTAGPVIGEGAISAAVGDLTNSKTIEVTAGPLASIEIIEAP